MPDEIRPTPQPPRWFIRALPSFLTEQAAGGLILMAMMVVALVLANSPLAANYWRILDLPLGAGAVEMSLLHWVNEGLMAVFFLLVALEIKREVLEGSLSSPNQVVLPAAAAVGGMAVPAALYLILVWGNEDAWRGWAIPSATDIAFSLGVLSLLGNRVPQSLRVFLMALAIIDDLGAIIIIAVFYGGTVSWLHLGGALAIVAALPLLARLGLRHLAFYVAAGAAVWLLMHSSGIHATLAGVALGLAMPLETVRRLEHTLNPWVAFGILPVFALVNSGVPLGDVGTDELTEPVFLGVALGLFLGKQLGVLAATAAMIGLGLASLPTGAGWRQLYGVALLTGIGFTMSLFIGGLAFPSGGDSLAARLGVLAGSLASALAGWAVLAGAKANALRDGAP